MADGSPILHDSTKGQKIKRPKGQHNHHGFIPIAHFLHP
uniref:Uncharacterized protein n=1 Tax=Anguilla anguilla TaxID=7936 RepID=A0A0E9QFX9_ANGAN